MKKQPIISIVIPTHNNEKTIGECLKSLIHQDYPVEKREIIVVDGFSTDNTRTICRKYGCIILDNPYIIHPKGRPIGIRASKGEFILCLDSDNVLTSKNWLACMVEPFSDKLVVGTEPMFYSARKKDSLITKYISLIGADDPVAMYLGFFDRFSYVKNRWTDSRFLSMRASGYEKVKFRDLEKIPPLGANGFIVRKKEIEKIDFDPFLHVEIVRRLLKKGFWFCKVRVGIIHMHGDSMNRFILKKTRRIKRRKSDVHKHEWRNFSGFEMLSTLLKLLLVIPVVYDTFKGFARKPSRVWFLHPYITYATFFTYAYNMLFFKARYNSNDYEKV